MFNRLSEVVSLACVSHAYLFCKTPRLQDKAERAARRIGIQAPVRVEPWDAWNGRGRPDGGWATVVSPDTDSVERTYRRYIVARIEHAEHGAHYTGDPDEGGRPCSDCCHDWMTLPDGAWRLTVNWVCARCHKGGGYHHREAWCPEAIVVAGDQRFGTGLDSWDF